MKPAFAQPSPDSGALARLPSLAELEAQVQAAIAERCPSAGTATAIGDVEDQASRLRSLMGGAESPRLRNSESVALPIEARSEAHKPPADNPHIAPFTIAVASGKGGVGKTNITVNLAAALAGMGYKVTVLDADLGTANADVLCGLTPAARLDHVFAPGGLECHDGGRRTLRDIIVTAPGGFRLIPGSAGVSRMADLSALERHRLFTSLSDLDHDTDLLLIDTAAGVGRSVTAFLDAADICLTVATPEPTAITDVYALIKCASATEMRVAEWGSGAARPQRASPVFRLVVNQCGDDSEARRVYARLRAVCARFLGVELAMAGWVAQDVRVAEAVRARQLFSLRSPSTEAALNLSALATSLAQDVGPPSGAASISAPSSRLASALRRLLRLT